MSPFMISLTVFVLSLAAGTLLGAPALMLGMRLAEGPPLPLRRALLAGFCATLAALLMNSLVLFLLDRPSQSLIGFGFFAAALAAGLASYAAVMKFSDVYLEKVPVVWTPYAVLLIAVLTTARVQGWELRESYGFYRGYESLWVYNMPEVPEAMIHPESTIGFYNAQLRKLRRRAEESGTGHILTTFTHRDLKWFNDNFPWICRVNARSDSTGIERVIQDPRALKLLALLAIARPIYGKVERSAILGREAIVKMDSGQIIRLRKEGHYWKIRDFLGMKPIIMQRIYGEKERHEALTDEDRQESATGFSTYESETELLARQLGIEYQPFYPFMADPDGEEPANRAAAILRSVHSSPAGGSGSSDYKPEPLELADLSYELPVLPPVAPLEPEPAGTGDDRVTSGDQATVNPAHAADASDTADADRMRATPDAPAPRPKEGATTVADAKASRRDCSTSITPPVPPETLLSLSTASLPASSIIPGLRPGDVPVETLWSVYFSALEKIEKGDEAGVDEFLSTVSQEDAAWFRSNVPLLVQLVAPRKAEQLSPGEAGMAVLKAMVRNMPRSPKASILFTRKGGTGIARFIENGPEGLQTYTTVVALEGSRWVFVRPFFARTFIWTPQLAWYKTGRGMALTPEETQFLREGYEPLQKSVQAIYRSVGYSGGIPVVRHIADQAVPAGD